MSDFLKPIEVLQNYVSNIFGGSGSLKNLVIGPQGFIRLGQTGYDTGTGFWLGDAAGTAKFSIGNSSGNKLTWNGTNLVFSGNLSAASGTLGSITIGTNAWHVDSNGNMWWGDFATYAAATIKISAAGAINFTSGIISGEVKIGTSTDYFRALSVLDGSYIQLYLASKCCVQLYADADATAGEPHGLVFFNPVDEAFLGGIYCGTDMQFKVAAGHTFYFTDGHVRLPTNKILYLGASYLQEFDADNLRIVGKGTSPNRKIFLYDNITINGIIVQQAWQTPTLVNSWVNYDTTFNSAQYMKDKQGFVHLKGLIKDGTLNARAYTLPEGYCPVKREIHAQICNANAIGRCDVYPTGEVSPISGSNAYFSLDGITFKAV